MECWNGNGSLRAGRKSTIGRAVTWTHQDAGPWSSYNAACAVRAYASSSPTARTVDWAKNDLGSAAQAPGACGEVGLRC